MPIVQIGVRRLGQGHRVGSVRRRCDYHPLWNPSWNSQKTYTETEVSIQAIFQGRSLDSVPVEGWENEVGRNELHCRPTAASAHPAGVLHRCGDGPGGPDGRTFVLHFDQSSAVGWPGKGRRAKWLCS